jgi:hypothetical protein
MLLPRMSLLPSFARQGGPSPGITVNYDCPWCDTHQVAKGLVASETYDDVWLTMVCASTVCQRPAFLHIPLEGNNGTLWRNMSGSDPTFLQHGPLKIWPSPRPNYEDEGVPEPIRRDFEEALQCQESGYRFGAALVGRRVLQAAVRDRGGKGNNLKEEIDSLLPDVLNAPLKDGAHEVRLVGNEAAHAEDVEEEDVDALLGFAMDVLDALYVIPFRVAERKKAKSPAKK